MTENEINVTSTCIAALANQPNSEEKIKLLLTSLFESYSKEGFLDEPEKEKSFSSVSAPLIFTQKEISNMATTFKKVSLLYLHFCWGYFFILYIFLAKLYSFSFF